MFIRKGLAHPCLEVLWTYMAICLPLIFTYLFFQLRFKSLYHHIFLLHLTGQLLISPVQGAFWFAGQHIRWFQLLFHYLYLEGRRLAISWESTTLLIKVSSLKRWGSLLGPGWKDDPKKKLFLQQLALISTSWREPGALTVIPASRHSQHAGQTRSLFAPTLASAPKTHKKGIVIL